MITPELMTKYFLQHITGFLTKIRKERAQYVSKVPVKTGTNGQPMATASQQTAIATCQLQYPMPKISDPETDNKRSVPA